MFTLLVTLIIGTNIEVITTIPNISGDKCAEYSQIMNNQFEELRAERNQKDGSKLYATCTKQ